MGIYLGSNQVNFTSAKETKLDEIINDTISGVFESDEVTRIKMGAFYSCKSLTSVNFPNCTEIGSSAFDQCASLLTASFPKCSILGTYAFFGCLSLATISFPNCTTIGSNAFVDCRHLTTVNFPKCTTTYNYAFEGCNLLSIVSLPECILIASSAFRNCYSLVSLYLNLVSSIPSLTNSNAFSSTPIEGYTTLTSGIYGSIFVPSSLYSSFLTATNWSFFSARIVSV